MKILAIILIVAFIAFLVAGIILYNGFCNELNTVKADVTLFKQSVKQHMGGTDPIGENPKPKDNDQHETISSCK